VEINIMDEYNGWYVLDDYLASTRGHDSFSYVLLNNQYNTVMSYRKDFDFIHETSDFTAIGESPDRFRWRD
jgi:hypothetical protein